MFFGCIFIFFFFLQNPVHLSIIGAFMQHDIQGTMDLFLVSCSIGPAQG